MTLHTEGLAEFRETGDKHGIAAALYYIGSTAHDMHEYGRALASFRESLTVCRELGDRWLSGMCFEKMARLATVHGHRERAARLFGSAERVHETLGWRLPPADQADHDERVASTRAALGESIFAAAWAEGRAMTLEQAIEYALAPETG